MLYIKLPEFNTNDEDFFLKNQEENLQNFDIDEFYEIQYKTNN